MYVDPNFVTYKAYPIYSDTATIAMRKGFSGAQIIGVFSNKGSAGANYTQIIPNTGFNASESVVEVLSCATVVTGSGGAVTVPMGAGQAKVCYLCFAVLFF